MFESRDVCHALLCCAKRWFTHSHDDLSFTLAHTSLARSLAHPTDLFKLDAAYDAHEDEYAAIRIDILGEEHGEGEGEGEEEEVAEGEEEVEAAGMYSFTLTHTHVVMCRGEHGD